LLGLEPKSPFEIACEKLVIEVIIANSPQAKGRVERNHGVYQDRFVKEMRLRGISTIDDANRFLEMEYLSSINRKFSKQPTSRDDAHVPVFKRQDFRNVFCFENIRVVSNDYIVQIDCKSYQILNDNKIRPRPGKKVIVRRWLDGSVHCFFKDKELLVEEYKTNNTKNNVSSLSA